MLEREILPNVANYGLYIHCSKLKYEPPIRMLFFMLCFLCASVSPSVKWEMIIVLLPESHCEVTYVVLMIERRNQPTYINISKSISQMCLIKGLVRWAPTLFW